MRTDSRTSIDCLNTLLAGDPPAAGHFMMPLIKQFCAIQLGRKYGAYSQDYRVLTDCQLELEERWPIDCFNVLGYPYREASDCGLPVTFPEDDQPVAHGTLVREPGDLRALRWPAPDDGPLMSDRLNAIRAFRRARPDMVAMGAVEAPFAQACTFLGIQETMLALYDRPDFVRELIEWITPHEIDFALAQIEAGAAIIFIGDSLASQVGAAAYAAHIVEAECRVVDAIQSAGAAARLHICGDITPILKPVLRTGARMLDIDYPVAIAAACTAAAEAPPGTYVVGNFHPVTGLLQGDPDDVQAVCRACETQADGCDNFILSPGCEVPPETPAENYEALIRFGWKHLSHSEQTTNPDITFQPVRHGDWPADGNG